MGKGDNFSSACLPGVLSLAGGTYPGWGLPTLAREVPYLTGGTYFCLEYLPWQEVYLPLQGGSYLGWEGTYLGQGVPTLAWGGSYLFGRVSTITMGYLP